MRNGASGLGRILFKFCTAISTQTGCTGSAGVVCIPTITPSTRLFPGGSVVKNLPTNAGDWGLVPGSGRSPGEGNVNPLQYSFLENPMDRGGWWTMVHGVAKSRTSLSMHQTLGPNILTTGHCGVRHFSWPVRMTDKSLHLFSTTRCQMVHSVTQNSCPFPHTPLWKENKVY